MSELRNFILRGETLGLYRAFMRASSVVPQESRGMANMGLIAEQHQ